MKAKDDRVSSASKPACLDDDSLGAVREATTSTREPPSSDGVILGQKTKDAEGMSYRGRPTRPVTGQTR